MVIELGDTNDAAAQPKHFWNNRPSVHKHNKAQVPMLFFCEETYQGISAVMYCPYGTFSSPYLAEELGENICVVHNPLAKNPLPNGFFPFGDEYKVEGEYLTKIRSSSSYHVMFQGLIKNVHGSPD